jgi:hypothetical protein
MVFEKASEQELTAPRFDRRKANKGRAPLVDVSGWQYFAKLDVSAYRGEEAFKVARSIRSQARKRGWFIREVSWNVFVRFPAYSVSRDGVVVDTVPARNEADAVMTVSQGVAGNWSASLQE